MSRYSIIGRKWRCHLDQYLNVAFCATNFIWFSFSCHIFVWHLFTCEWLYGDAFKHNSQVVSSQDSSHIIQCTERLMTTRSPLSLPPRKLQRIRAQLTRWLERALASAICPCFSALRLKLTHRRGRYLGAATISGSYNCSYSRGISTASSWRYCWCLKRSQSHI